MPLLLENDHKARFKNNLWTKIFHQSGFFGFNFVKVAVINYRTLSHFKHKQKMAMIKNAGFSNLVLHAKEAVPRFFSTLVEDFHSKIILGLCMFWHENTQVTNKIIPSFKI